MKPENLEPLLLDRALGALSPEVTDLLEEYMTRDPAATQRAAALAATLKLARGALESPATAGIRPLAMARFKRAERQMRWRSHLGELAKLAACLTLGLLLGRAIRSGPSQPETAPARAVLGTLASAGVPAPESRFWSVTGLTDDRRMESARADRREPSYKLHWKSPLKMPRVEGIR